VKFGHCPLAIFSAARSFALRARGLV
jgi:hypothetical protein